jgi:hypothetical protein
MLTRTHTTLMRRIILVLLFLALFGCSSGPQLPLTILSSDLQPLRTEFNHDAGHVRMLLLMDPT